LLLINKADLLTVEQRYVGILVHGRE
jgi:hypothetical protein